MTHKIKRTFSGDVSITAEIIDTEKEFKWKLISGMTETRYTSYYEGILTLKIDNRLFGYASGYWANVLPIEQPFEIIKGTP